MKELEQNLKALYSLVQLDRKVSAWCSKCKDGYIREKAGFWYKTVICECQIKASYYNNLIELLRNSNIEKSMLFKYDFQKYKEDTLLLSDIYDTIYSKKWMYFFWTTWTWKSFSAFLVLIFSVILEKVILYVNVPKLMDALRPTVEDKWKERMERCIDSDVLVMDDIWQEKPSEWVRERLYIIINERYTSGKLTVFTSNTSLDKLQEKLNHPAILSRLRWECSVFDFSGKDKRL